jgi:hypothetical protein
MGAWISVNRPVQSCSYSAFRLAMGDETGGSAERAAMPRGTSIRITRPLKEVIRASHRLIVALPD